jgi:hypothetical protein
MASKAKRARMAPVRDLGKTFLYWAIAVFVVKLLIIFNIQGVDIEISGRPFFLDGVWLGADGENYLKGYEALSREGLFSKEGILNYWPAGYPIVILLLSLLGQSWALTTLSIVQSAVFSIATYFFALQIYKTRLKRFSYLIFLVILFNPTLTFTSLLVGYESFTASGLLLIVSIIVKDQMQSENKKFIWYLILSSSIFGFLTFLQPRLLISALLINFVWIYSRSKSRIKVKSLMLLLSLLLTLSYPAILVYRNYVAVQELSVSTNLGTTMNIGAGVNATGGYMNENYGVPCNLVGDAVQQDREKVLCVLRWYASNPDLTVKLFGYKSLMFWSPWVNNNFLGDVFIGTMNRNPWLSIHPARVVLSAPNGTDLVFGSLGKLISWFWLLGGVISLFYGFITLWRQEALERFIGSIAMIAICSSWFVSLMSIGDHRFRIPIMGMSLFLQIIGLKTLFNKGKAPMVDVPALR